IALYRERSEKRFLPSEIRRFPAQPDRREHRTVRRLPVGELVVDEDMGALRLRQDVLLRVQEVRGDRLQDLRLLVSTEEHVTAQLPPEEQLRLGLQEDREVVEILKLPGRKAEEASDEDDIVRLDHADGPEGAVRVD